PAINGTKDAIFAGMPQKNADVTISDVATATYDEKRVTRSLPTAVEISWFKDGNSDMMAIYGHGSPFVNLYFISKGSPKIHFADKPTVWSGNEKSDAIGVTVSGKHYAIFSKMPVAWE